MHDRALAHVHHLALRNRRFERRLVANPRAVLHSFRMRFRAMDDGDRGDAKNAQGLPAFDAEDLRILHALTR